MAERDVWGCLVRAVRGRSAQRPCRRWVVDGAGAEQGSSCGGVGRPLRCGRDGLSVPRGSSSGRSGRGRSPSVEKCPGSRGGERKALAWPVGPASGRHRWAAPPRAAGRDGGGRQPTTRRACRRGPCAVPESRPPDSPAEIAAMADTVPDIEANHRSYALWWVATLYDDPAAMRQLASSAKLLIRRSVARAVHLPRTSWSQPAHDEDRVVRLFLTESCDDAPADLLLDVWTWWPGSFSFPGRPRTHPNFPRDGLLRFADDPEPRLRLLALFDPASDADLVERFSRDPDGEVRRRAAEDPRLSPRPRSGYPTTSQGFAPRPGGTRPCPGVPGVAAHRRTRCPGRRPESRPPHRRHAPHDRADGQGAPRTGVKPLLPVGAGQ